MRTLEGRYTINVIIPTFNRKQDVRNILNDIREQDTLHELNVILIIDGSTDGTLEMVEEDFPYVQIVTGRDMWYTKSMIKGYEFAKTSCPDFYLTLNDDCRLPRDYVTKLLDAYTQIGIQDCLIGSISFSVETPTQIIFSGVKEISWWRYKVKYYIPKGFSRNPNDYTGIKLTRSLPGRGILIPSKVINKIGFFDQRFIQYYSDSEFVFRCWKNDIPAYISYDAKVFTYLSKTGLGSIHNGEPFLKFMRNFFNPYARNYLLNISRIIWIYGVKPLWLLTLAVKILGHLKIYLLKKE